MEIKAQLKHLHIAPRKVRLVADAVRGLTVEQATRRLDHLTKRSSMPIRKLVLSAAANAKHNFKIDGGNAGLVIKEIRVDQGPALKRFSPRAFGRAAMIKKKMSHLSVILASKGGVKKDKKIKDNKKK